LDKYKYPTRYENVDALKERSLGEGFLSELNNRLENFSFLFGNRACIADYAIAPFVRQFAHVDKVWFDQRPYTALQNWLNRFLSDNRFAAVMTKFPQWQEGDTPRLMGK